MIIYICRRNRRLNGSSEGLFGLEKLHFCVLFEALVHVLAVLRVVDEDLALVVEDVQLLPLLLFIVILNITINFK